MELSFDKAKQKIEKKAKTISEHTVEKAKIWNRSRYRQAELYGQQKVVLLSDIETVLGDLQKRVQKLCNLQELIDLLAQNPIDVIAVKAWQIRFKEKAEKLLEATK